MRVKISSGIMDHALEQGLAASLSDSAVSLAATAGGSGSVGALRRPLTVVRPVDD
jgi:hypothetical protein